MNKLAIGIVVGALVLTAAPFAVGYGFDPTQEPNYLKPVHGAPGDIENAKNTFAAPNSNRVYFDALVETCPGWLVCTQTPNQNTFADPNGRIFSPGFAAITFAYLGIWRDCNGDGYIGDGTDGLSVYPAVSGSPALANCGLDSGFAYKDVSTGAILISEFRWIGAQQKYGPPACGQADLLGNQDTADCTFNAIEDSAARVWGDWALPTQKNIVSQGVIPLPPGTLDDTYSLGQYVDDASLGLVDRQYNSALGAGAWQNRPDAFKCDAYSNPVRSGGCHNNGPISDGDSPTLIARNKFNDSESPQGNGGAGNPMVTVWSCGTDYSGNCGGNDCTATAGLLPGVDPQVNPTFVGDATHQGGLDETWALAFEPFGAITGSGTHGPDPTHKVAKSGPGCDSAANSDFLPAVVIFPELELGQQSVTQTHFKIDHEYSYVQDQGLPALPNGDPYGMPADVTGNADARLAAGVNGGGWYGGASWSERPPRALWGKISTVYTSHYATIGPASVAAGAQLPAMPSGAGTYGADGQCPSGFGAYTSPTGWDCNKADWNSNIHDLNDPATEYWQTQPNGQTLFGAPYQLRDIDCYDNYVASAAGQPVYAGGSAEYATVLATLNGLGDPGHTATGLVGGLDGGQVGTC